MIKTPHDLAEVVQPENFEVSEERCVSYTNLLGCQVRHRVFTRGGF